MNQIGANCENCVNNNHGKCAKGMRFGRNNCYAFCRKRSNIEKSFEKAGETLKAILVVVFTSVLVFGGFYGYYCWTKSSLEDLTGKEVKSETVIWTMFVTNGK